MSKSEQVNKLIVRLKSIADKALNKGNYNRAAAAISFASETLYQYNQFYVDDELESLAKRLGQLLKSKGNYASYSKSDNTDKILFYDGFGLDTRGVALMYLNAFMLNKYSVVYVTDQKCKDRIPTMSAICKEAGFDMEFIDMDNYSNWANQLASIFDNYKPRSAFFYTKANDAAGTAVFSMYEGIVDRYLIDLTDHAFWLGKCGIDFFLGSREMSAYNLTFNRGIPKERSIKIGVNLMIQESDDHSGLPFDVLNTRYFFSGGALYKTLGDADNYFYRIAEHVLENHSDMHFLYAGAGDDSEMKKLIEKFPGRVYLIAERKDFYYLIQNSVFYLNTYPMFGGMMMKYAAHAKRIPITLRHGNDADGLLITQKESQIEYDTYEEVVEDLDKLLSDNDYMERRRALLEGSVITEERFKNNLRGVIENQKTDYSHSYIELDTTEFRKEFFERFSYNDNKYAVVRKRNLSLLRYFPLTFLIGVPKKAIGTVIRSK